MKIPTSEHFPRHVRNTSIFRYMMEAIKRKLIKWQLRLFKKYAFSNFAKNNTYVFSGAIMHNALLRQVAHDVCCKDQLWFEFGGQLAWLSITKWCLVMGLCYGLHNMHRKPNIIENYRLHDLYYNRNPGVNIIQSNETLRSSTLIIRTTLKC